MTSTITPERATSSSDEGDAARTLDPDLLRRMHAYWRAANYLSVGQIYLYDNPLLRRPLALADVKPLVDAPIGVKRRL